MVSLKSRATVSAHFPPKGFSYLSGRVRGNCLCLLSASLQHDTSMVEVAQLDSPSKQYSFSPQHEVTFFALIDFYSVLTISNHRDLVFWSNGHAASSFQFPVCYPRTQG